MRCAEILGSRAAPLRTSQSRFKYVLKYLIYYYFQIYPYIIYLLIYLVNNIYIYPKLYNNISYNS